MENNTNYQNQYNQAPYQQYVHPYYQQIDPNYDAISKDFLTQAIVSCAISSLPIGSIIAIFMGNLYALHCVRDLYLDLGSDHRRNAQMIRVKFKNAAASVQGAVFLCLVQV